MYSLVCNRSVCLPSACIHLFATGQHIQTIQQSLHVSLTLMYVAFCRAGIDLATVEVRMDKLKVEADIAVGSRGNPTVTNTLRNMAEVMTCIVAHTGQSPLLPWHA